MTKHEWSSKKETFALARWGRSSEWFLVDETAGSEHDGEPWFIGVGAGFDILRLVVYAGSESDAIEIAEEEWPDSMGTELTDEEAEEAESEGRSLFYAEVGAGMAPFEEREIRILSVAKRVEEGNPDKYGRDAKLTSGEVIEYK